MPIFITPPLSDFDFSISISSNTQESIVIDDIEYKGQIVTGVCDIFFLKGNGSTILSSLSENINIDPYGNFIAVGKGKILVKGNGLAKTKTINTEADSIIKSYVDGSLGKHLINGFNSLTKNLEATETTRNLFINYNETTGACEWNPECWAYPVDLTCMSSWRDKAGIGSSESSNLHWPVTAITNRLIACGHIGTWVGESYHWITKDNSVVSRTVVDIKKIHEDHPYYIALLNDDLPSSITPAKLFKQGALPENDIKGTAISDFIDADKIYTITTNLSKEAISNPIRHIYNGFVSTIWPDSNNFSKEIVGGDSSSPCFLTISNETVLLHSIYTGVGGNGLYYSAYYDEICQCIKEFKNEYDISLSYPETVSLSNFLAI